MNQFRRYLEVYKMEERERREMDNERSIAPTL